MKMQSRKSFFILSLTGGLLLMLCCRTPTPQPSADDLSRTLRVKAVRVVRDSVILPLFVPGKLSSRAEMKLSFKTGGIIRYINAVEGATVRSGATLAVLDTVEFVAARNKALTLLEKTSRDLKRIEKLYRDSVATLEQLQNAASAFSAAQSDSAIAFFNLSQAVIKAPCSGKILKRLAERNEIVGPGMPVIVLASGEENWILKAAVPDRDLPLLSIGDKADAAFDAIPGIRFPAKIVRISAAAHPVTGTFEIELLVDTTPHPLFRSGMIADIRLFPSKQAVLDFIPASALAEAQGDTGKVYAIYKNDSLVLRRIKLARIFGDLIAVSRGLEGIDEVVGPGAAYIADASGRIAIER